VGLDREDVVDQAVAVLEEVGRVDGVALREVAARLGVRTQSLYAHVDGADGLRRALALRGLDALAERLTTAAIGRAGADAVEAIVRAYLDFALEHPGLFEAAQRPPGDDAELVDAMGAVMRPLNLVFESYGLGAEAAVHWYRIVWASVYGFAVLRRNGLFTLPGDVDDTLTHLVQAIVHQIEAEVSAPEVSAPEGRRSRRR
jgi:AcrR family transcriptional regulator